MKLTTAKCTSCDRRDCWTRPQADPRCGDCGAVMDRTSRLAIGRWYRDGQPTTVAWGRPATLDYSR